MGNLLLLILFLLTVAYLLKGLIDLVWTIAIFIYQGVKTIAGHLNTIRMLINGEMKREIALKQN